LSNRLRPNPHRALAHPTVTLTERAIGGPGAGKGSRLIPRQLKGGKSPSPRGERGAMPSKWWGGLWVEGTGCTRGLGSNWRAWDNPPPPGLLTWGRCGVPGEKSCRLASRQLMALSPPGGGLECPPPSKSGSRKGLVSLKMAGGCGDAPPRLLTRPPSGGSLAGVRRRKRVGAGRGQRRSRGRGEEREGGGLAGTTPPPK